MDQVENSTQIEGFEFSPEDVVIDPFSCDLNLVVDKECLLAYPLSNDAFCSIWAGCRSTYGVNSGRVAFEVHLEDYCEANNLPKDDLEPYLIRVGWSLNHSPLQLGESPFSFGFSNNAKKCCDKLFENYGDAFEKGDSIAAYLDFETEKNHVLISFGKNGLDLGTAFKINVKDIRDYSRKNFDEENFIFFPHVLSKNVVFEMNFGQRVSLIGDEPFAPIKANFELIQKLSLEKRFSNPVVSKNKKDYQVVIMVGLPGSGKSKWVKDFCTKNFDKNYYVIGIGSILEKMKVLNPSKKANSSQAGEFTNINSIASYSTSKVQPDLLDKAFKCMNTLMEIASQSYRNIIIDQANVYQSTRRRKLKMFQEYTTKAVCIIPTDEVYNERLDLCQKEDGKPISINLINDMKIGFSLPNASDFDSIEYAELSEQESFNLIEHYNSQAQTDRLNLLLESRAKKNEEKRKSLAINPTLLMRPVYRPNYAFATGISSLSSQLYGGNRFSRSLPPRRPMTASYPTYTRPGVAYAPQAMVYGSGYAMMQQNVAAQQWNPALPYQGAQPYLVMPGQYTPAWPPQYQTGQNQWDPVVSTNLSQSISSASNVPNNFPPNNQN